MSEFTQPPAPHPWISEHLDRRSFRYALERTRSRRAWPRHPWHLRGWL